MVLFYAFDVFFSCVGLLSKVNVSGQIILHSSLQLDVLLNFFNVTYKFEM